MNDMLMSRRAAAVRHWQEKLAIMLDGKTIMLEAATGNYAAMPAVSVVAGAGRVILITRENAHGTARDAELETLMCFNKFGISAASLEFVPWESMLEMAGEAHLVLNGGNTRPFRRNFIERMKPGATIGLMYDAWELRPGEIDLQACVEHKIKVAGVHESDRSLGIFRASGSLAVKMAWEAGYEINNNTIVIWSDDEFGAEAARSFQHHGAAVSITTDPEELIELAPSADFVFLCDYSENRSYTGPDAVFDFARLARANPALGIVHLYGMLDPTEASRFLPVIHPFRAGGAQRMTCTLDAVGPRVSIGLHAAGLKAADAVFSGLPCSFAQEILP